MSLKNAGSNAGVFHCPNGLNQIVHFILQRPTCRGVKSDTRSAPPAFLVGKEGDH